MISSIDRTAKSGGEPLDAQASAGNAVWVQLLGPFRVYTARGAMPDALWRGTRARALFKYLAYRAGTPVSRDALLDTLWSDLDAESSQNTLHKAVHMLRQTIELAMERDGKELLEFGDGCYTLHTERLKVDVLQFKRALFEARWCERLGDTAGMRSQAEAAVALYHGDLLEDDYLAEWAISERERLRADYLLTLRRLAALVEGEPERQAGYLRQLLSADPAAEDAYRGLICIALSAGQRGEALRLYRQYKTALTREPAMLPNPDIDALIARL